MFFWNSYFSNDPLDVGNLISGSSAFSKSSLNIWKFMGIIAMAMTSDAKYAKARAEDPNERQDIIVIYWWPDYVDPSSYFYSCFYSEEKIGYNLSYYYNPEVDALIDKV